MYLNQPKDPAATLNDDAHYRPWREFWARRDVEAAVISACRQTRDDLSNNTMQFTRELSTTHDEFYSRVVKPWFVPPDATDDPVRMKLRHSRLDDVIREQGLITLFHSRLPAALKEVPTAEDFLSAQWDAKDWSELLNASAWSVLDEALAAHAAPSGENRQSFCHLKMVYGYALKAPVTHLAKKLALRFARSGLLRMHYQDQYLAAAGPVYRSFYRDVYVPVTTEFRNKL